MKRNHTLLSQGARRHPIRRRHTSITWIGEPIRGANRHKWGHVNIQVQEGPLVSISTKRGRLVGPAHGRPITLVGRWPLGPTSFELQHSVSLLALNIVSVEDLPISQPKRGWLPSIYMRGGAPFQDMEGWAPSTSQDTQIVSRFSLPSLVEVLGLEEFGYES